MQGDSDRKIQVPPTNRQAGQERMRNASAGLKMPGSDVSVDSKVREHRMQQERLTREEMEQKRREARRRQLESGRTAHEDDRIKREEETGSMKQEEKRPLSKKEIAWKKKIKKLWLILAGEVIALALLMVGFVVNYVNSKMNQMNINELDENEILMNEGLSNVTKEEYTTIALFGLDSRDVTSDKGNRSDCIIIAAINNKTKEVRLISIFRDTYLQVADRGGDYDGVYTKVTHAYAYGGPKAAIETLNKNLDLQITEYATVNFASLTKVIDDLGGVVVNVDEDERQSINIWLPETASIAGMSYSNVYETGDIVLDGLQATTYCRIRNIGQGDIDRAGRQREVIGAILDKAKQSDLVTLNKVIDDVLPDVSTSLTKKEMLGLLSGVFDYTISEGEGFPFIYKLTMVDNLSVEVPADLEKNVELLHQYLYDAVLPDTTISASTDTATDEEGNPVTGSTAGTTEQIDASKIYEPSYEVKNISDAIKNYTGVVAPEDPDFRGGF